MGVDMLGFNLDPEDPGAVTMEDYAEITGWLSGVRFVAEFSRSEISEIASVFCDLKPYAVEVSDPELPEDLNLRGIPSLLKLKLASGRLQDLEKVMDYCSGSVEYFILEAEGTVTENLKKILSELAGTYPVLLGGNLTTAQILELVDELPLKGISLKGSKELKPGFKDYEQLGDVLEALDVDDPG